MLSESSQHRDVLSSSFTVLALHASTDFPFASKGWLPRSRCHSPWAEVARHPLEVTRVGQAVRQQDAAHRSLMERKAAVEHDNFNSAVACDHARAEV